MATGSALDSQLMFAEETTPATAVTPTLALEHDSIDLRNEPTWSDPTSMRAGGRYVRRVSRQRQTGDNITGSVTLPVSTKGMSLLFKHCIASSVTAATTGTQAHTFGGTWAGKALTVQAGYPESLTPYTVRAITYAGCKVVSWEFACSAGAEAKLTLTLDGVSQSTATALATASYIAASSNYVFSDVTTATLGGSSLVTGGLVMTDISIKGDFPLATDRRGLGFGKAKAEQLLIGPPVITVDFSGEFNKAAILDPFIAETSTALAVTFTNGSSSLAFSLPATKIKGAAPTISGPEIVPASITLEGLDDETNPPISITVIN